MRTHGLVVIFMIVVLGSDSASQRATAGLPGYFEWVLWKDVQAENPMEQGNTAATLEWIVGPYPKLSDCEHDRDRLADATVLRAHQRGTGRRIATGGAVTVTADKSTT